MKKTETKKAAKPASKPMAKTAAKAVPAKTAGKKTAAKPVAKKNAPAKVEVKAVKTPAKKAAPVKAAPKAPVKKAAPVKAAPKAPAKKAAPVKATPKAPAKKAAPVKAAPKAPAKKAAPVKVEVKVTAAPVKPAPVKKAIASTKKKADKNKDAQSSHHGRIVTKAEVDALRIQAEANGHVIRKSHLSTKMKKHYREALLKLRASYLDQLNIHRDDALTNKKSGPGAGMATHMADLGSDNFQNDFELGLLSDEGTVIEMIEEALIRLDENEYGICLECGKEINPARLELKPYARFCVACKSRKEMSDGPDRRHR